MLLLQPKQALYSFENEECTDFTMTGVNQKAKAEGKQHNCTNLNYTLAPPSFMFVEKLSSFHELSFHYKGFFLQALFIKSDVSVTFNNTFPVNNNFLVLNQR